jgi:hypothetical protein
MTAMQAIQGFQEAERERLDALEKYREAKRRLEVATTNTDRHLSYVRNFRAAPAPSADPKEKT